MPATSLFTPSMEYLADSVPAIQSELARAEMFIQSLATDASARISQWLEDESVECFFEIGINKCDALQV